MDKKVECKYSVTATIRADTIYELEAIKAALVRVGARSFASTPLQSSRQSVQTHQQTLTAKGSATISLVPSISLCVCGQTLRSDLLRASFYSWSVGRIWSIYNSLSVILI
jgi:hypothetical protein